MKKLLYLILPAIMLCSCVDENETFTGYLVAKEYTTEHMSNETPKTLSYAAVFIPSAQPHANPPPHKIEAQWVWFIANKDAIIERNVSEQMFNTKKCGDKITIKLR